MIWRGRPVAAWHWLEMCIRDRLYNYKMEPLLDPLGNPVVAETPDANSLLKIDNKLFLVTHYEYCLLYTSRCV